MGEVCAAKEIRTPTPSYRRYHLKVVRLPISPSPHFLRNCKFRSLRLHKKIENHSLLPGYLHADLRGTCILFFQYDPECCAFAWFTGFHK